jgi:predicted transposase/invertase (TIGR01784 family)
MEHKHILKHFLNCVLPDGIEVEDILKIENSTQVKSFEEQRGVEYDIYCTDIYGIKFIVEMQNQSQLYFIERMLYYVSKAVVEQGQPGKDWKYSVLPVHFVGILNFYIDNEVLSGDVVQHIQLKNQDDKIVTNILSYTLVQLPLFEKDLPEILNDRERWFYVFNHFDKLKQIPQTLKTSIFEEVFEINEHFKMNPRTRQLWEEGIKRQRDFHNQLDFARREGEIRGKLEGERAAYIAIAKKLKDDGNISFEMISTITGISIQEIINL